MGPVAGASPTVSQGSRTVSCSRVNSGGSLAGLRTLVPSVRLLVADLGCLVVSFGSLVAVLRGAVAVLRSLVAVLASVLGYVRTAVTTSAARMIFHAAQNTFREGVDVQARLPLLSTYMGHAEPVDTQWYLTAAPELLGLLPDGLSRRSSRCADELARAHA